MTEQCLRSLLEAINIYENMVKLNYHIFLTDDACTDGTAEGAKVICGNTITIVYADGNAFWAGGMRMAWKEAMKKGCWDFFLLLNDDCVMMDILFYELFEAHQYALSNYGKEGVYSGNTCRTDDHSIITFGGKNLSGRLIKRFIRVVPNGKPQKCQIVNANILMVHSSVVEKIGIFPECYVHGAADNDYGMRANAAGFPVLVTSGFCGMCDSDNYNHKMIADKLSRMSITERMMYFKNPVHSSHDVIEFCKRWRKINYFPTIILEKINILSPKIYLFLYKHLR